MEMNSDFNFKKFQWKKLAAFALCMILTLQSSAVFAATQSSEEPEASYEMTLLTKKTGDVSGCATFKNNQYAYTYTGKTIKPQVTVKGFTTGKKISSQYYTVKYGQYVNGKFQEKTPKAMGYYVVQITFKGAYKNYPTINQSFRIVPPKATMNGVTAKKNGMKVS